jgi:signal peptidase I
VGTGAVPAGPVEPAKRHRALVAWGLGLAILSVVLLPLWIPAIVLGILAIVRGRVVPGIVIVVLSVVLPVIGAILLQVVVFKAYRTPSESMEPTLSVGDRFLVNKLGSPSVGDVVVFHPPAGASTNECGAPHPDRQMCPRAVPEELDSLSFVKRIVAGPGDRVALRDGRVVRNGKVVTESYIRPCLGDEGGCDFPAAITVPPGQWFMLGDNRPASDDSRYWGPVPEDWIVGTKVLTYWHG